jgi:hypothetical protein
MQHCWSIFRIGSFNKRLVAILLALLSYLVFVVINRLKFFISIKEFIAIVVVAFLVCFMWFGVDFIKND